jgi:hypothetical protein
MTEVNARTSETVKTDRGERDDFAFGRDAGREEPDCDAVGQEGLPAVPMVASTRLFDRSVTKPVGTVG